MSEPHRIFATTALGSLLAGVLALAGCNSDEIPQLTASATETTGDLTKEPFGTLSGSTDPLPPPPSDMPIASYTCRDILDCLFSGQVGEQPCYDLETEMIDQGCVIKCVGHEGATLEEWLWGFDLGLCAAQQCSMPEETDGGMDSDTDGGVQCDGTQVLDFSNACIQCIVLKILQNAPGCEEQQAMCD
ncbi:MAG: hypothetical protein R3A51_03525 [Nannocystaceae bacterium]|nr:hypothetical protein [Myxococcales bacterium]